MTLSYETAKELLQKRLSRAAFEHGLAVADTAAELARAYSVDVDKARLAGLLHDWDREQDHDSLLAAAVEAGHEPHRTEIAHPRLLHARTGAHRLRTAFPGIPADVVRAIERHTLGAPDMTPLDMVVYLADMLEPGRSYPGVDELRAVVGRVELAELFARGYQRSVAHLVERRRPIHPVTVEVWNALVAKERR